MWVALGTLACAMSAAGVPGSEGKAVQEISSLIAKYAQAVGVRAQALWQ